jgi:hypothetical protein
MAKRKIYGADIIGDLSVSGDLTASIFNDYVPKTTSVLAGAGMLGGGYLLTDQQLAVDIASTADITARTPGKILDAQGLGNSVPTLIGANIDIPVGTYGDYQRLGEALNAISKYRRIYLESQNKLTPNEPLINIVLLSGFVLSEHIFIRGHNFIGVTISSVDSEVTVNHSALAGYNSVFDVGHGIAPVIQTKFRMSTGAPSALHGIYCTTGGVVYFATSGNTSYTGLYGFRACGGYNILCRHGGYVVAMNGVFTGGGVGGIRATSGGQIHALYADTRQVAGVNASTNISVAEGGIIYAHNARGGVSQTVNTQTSSGYIYQ